MKVWVNLDKWNSWCENGLDLMGKLLYWEVLEKKRKYCLVLI